MNSITNAVNTISSTVTNTIWGDNNENKPPTSDNQTTQPEHENKETLDTTASSDSTKDAAVKDRFPSVMGNTPPATEETLNPVPEISHLSMSEGHRNDALDMRHDKAGYPYSDSRLTEDTITGSSTGNTAMANVLIDGSGSIDRDLEGHDPRSEQTEKKHNLGHRRYDSGVEGLETQDISPEVAKRLYGAPGIPEDTTRTSTDVDQPYQGSVTERVGGDRIQDKIGEDQQNKEHYVPKLNAITSDAITAPTTTSKVEGADRENEHPNLHESTYSPAAFHPNFQHGSGLISTNITHENENKPRMNDAGQDRTTEHTKVASSIQSQTHSSEHISPYAALGSQREGLSSSNEPASQGDPVNPATTNAIHTMGKGFTSSAGGLGEPSIGGDVTSGVQPTHKHQGADKPLQEPGNDTPEMARHISRDQGNEGSGQLYEKSTGTVADGGDFDATRPGAGKEADRLLEQAGVNRSVPGGTAGAQLNEGHKFGHLVYHHSVTSSEGTSTSAGHEGEKKSIGEKIKEKLHIGSGKHND